MANCRGIDRLSYNTTNEYKITDLGSASCSTSNWLRLYYAPKSSACSHDSFISIFICNGFAITVLQNCGQVDGACHRWHRFSQNGMQARGPVWSCLPKVKPTGTLLIWNKRDTIIQRRENEENSSHDFGGSFANFVQWLGDPTIPRQPTNTVPAVDSYTIHIHSNAGCDWCNQCISYTKYSHGDDRSNRYPHPG